MKYLTHYLTSVHHFLYSVNTPSAKVPMKISYLISWPHITNLAKPSQFFKCCLLCISITSIISVISMTNTVYYYTKDGTAILVPASDSLCKGSGIVHSKESRYGSRKDEVNIYLPWIGSVIWFQGHHSTGIMKFPYTWFVTALLPTLHCDIMHLLLATSLLSSKHKWLMLRNIHLDHLSVGLSVGLSVCKVYCGKMADWIRIPFGVVSGIGRGMGVLDGGGDHWRGRSSFGVNLGPLWCGFSQITFQCTF